MKTNNLIIKSEENSKIIYNIKTLTDVLMDELRDMQFQEVINDNPYISNSDKLSNRAERLLDMVEELLDAADKNNEYIIKKLREIYPSTSGGEK